MSATVSLILDGFKGSIGAVEPAAAPYDRPAERVSLTMTFLCVGIGAAILLMFGREARTEEADMTPARALRSVVEVEEEVYRFTPAKNGADPMWCLGSTTLVRIGEDVFASGLETLKAVPPLNNVRWTLWKRSDKGWQLEQADEKHRTREPCPLACFHDGRLFMSANPTRIQGRKAGGGPARPEVLRFDAADPKATFKTLRPGWRGRPRFTEHSYRSFAADGPNGEMILFQNIGYTHSAWAFRDRTGRWAAAGELKWLREPDPSEAPYGRAGIRVNYPNVCLRGRAVHFCGASAFDRWERMPDVGDTHRKWGLRFRRLYYTWTPDVTKRAFSAWLELASTHKTGGWCFPGDLWVDAQGAAHVAWMEAPINKALRDQRFPDTKRTCALKYAIIRDGRVEHRATLAAGGEGAGGEGAGGKGAASEWPGAPDLTDGRFGRVGSSLGQPRLHATPDGRLFALYYVAGKDPTGKPVSENRMIELRGRQRPGRPVRLPLKCPLCNFFTATPRAGSAASDVIDLLGRRPGVWQTLCYARIRLR